MTFNLCRVFFFFFRLELPPNLLILTEEILKRIISRKRSFHIKISRRMSKLQKYEQQPCFLSEKHDKNVKHMITFFFLLANY